MPRTNEDPGLPRLPKVCAGPEGKDRSRRSGRRQSCIRLCQRLDELEAECLHDLSRHLAAELERQGIPNQEQSPSLAGLLTSVDHVLELVFQAGTRPIKRNAQ